VALLKRTTPTLGVVVEARLGADTVPARLSRDTCTRDAVVVGRLGASSPGCGVGPCDTTTYVLPSGAATDDVAAMLASIDIHLTRSARLSPW
jgi:hypothetical protein